MAKAVEINKRLEAIKNLLTSGKKYNMEEISIHLKELGYTGASVKTVYRDIGNLRKKYDINILKDPESRYYLDKNNSLMLPDTVISAENLKVIKILQNLLDTIKDTQIYDEAKEIFSQLSSLPTEEETNKTYSYHSRSPLGPGGPEASSRVVFLGAPSSNVVPGVWQEIYEAMETNYPVEIEYVAAGHTETTKYGVQPYQLIFDDGLWDLWGMSLKDKKRKQFNLSRIKNIKVRKDSQQFALPEDFDYRNHTPGTFGCYRDAEGVLETYRILLRKGSYAATYAKERIWGINSKVETTEEGTIIQFDNNQYKPILRWVMGWGNDAVPLQPEKLVTDWKENIKKMAENL